MVCHVLPGEDNGSPPEVTHELGMSPKSAIGMSHMTTSPPDSHSTVCLSTKTKVDGNDGHVCEYPRTVRVVPLMTHVVSTVLVLETLHYGTTPVTLPASRAGSNSAPIDKAMEKLAKTGMTVSRIASLTVRTV